MGSEDPWSVAHANSRKMMQARGYTAFSNLAQGMDYTCTAEAAADSPPVRLVTFFSTSSKLGLKDVRQVEERMTEMRISHATVVLQGGVTPPAKAHVVDKMRAQGYVVELFLLAELQFDLMEHHLVPKHRLLLPKEREAMFEKYGANNLPRMLLTDPVSRYFGLKRGQVMEIERISASGFHKMYRIAV